MYTFKTNARSIHSKLDYFSIISFLMFVLLISSVYCADRKNRLSGKVNKYAIWDIIPTITATKTTTTTTARPTRRPAPPIIHFSDEDYDQLKSETEVTMFQPRTTTFRPRRKWPRPRTTFRPTSHPKTQASVQALANPELLQSSWERLKKTLKPTPVGVDPCTWAVANCCESQESIQNACLQYLGCFLSDQDFCIPDLYRDAFKAVNKYLNL